MSNVVITGGSRGIGAAAVALFAARGDRVWFLYEKEHAAAAIVAEKTGATPICCDVADSAAVDAALAHIDVDVLICNAGAYAVPRFITSSGYDNVFQINFAAPYYLMRRLAPHLAARGGRVVLVGCPKLDGIDYSMKLTHILRENEVRSVTVVRMEVPCCGGIENAVKRALLASGKRIPWQVVTITRDGNIMK